MKPKLFLTWYKADSYLEVMASTKHKGPAIFSIHSHKYEVSMAFAATDGPGGIDLLFIRVDMNGNGDPLGLAKQTRLKKMPSKVQIEYLLQYLESIVQDVLETKCIKVGRKNFGLGRLKLCRKDIQVSVFDGYNTPVV